MEVGEALCDGAGVVEGAGAEGVREEDGLVAERAKVTDAGVDAVRVRGRGGGDDRDAGAGFESRWFEHH